MAVSKKHRGGVCTANAQWGWRLLSGCMCLYGLVSWSHGAMIIESIDVPPGGSEVWQLTSSGAARYSGGWIAWDAPTSSHFEDGGTYPLGPLLVKPVTADVATFASPMWGPFVVGPQSVVERLLFSWTIRIPAYRLGRSRPVITHDMLLLPQQIRIALAHLELTESQQE